MGRKWTASKYLVLRSSAHPRAWNASGKCVNCSSQHGPPRSPDFKLTDFCLSEHMADSIYKLKAEKRCPVLRHTLDSANRVKKNPKKTLVRNVQGCTTRLGVGMSNIHCKYAVYISTVSRTLIQCIVQIMTSLTCSNWTYFCMTFLCNCSRYRVTHGNLISFECVALSR